MLLVWDLQHEILVKSTGVLDRSSQRRDSVCRSNAGTFCGLHDTLQSGCFHILDSLAGVIRKHTFRQIVQPLKRLNKTFGLHITGPRARDENFAILRSGNWRQKSKIRGKVLTWDGTVAGDFHARLVESRIKRPQVEK